MSVFESVVVLTLCGLIGALQTGERWREAEGMSARQYAPSQQYGSYHLSPTSQIAFAAIPLHAPVPVLHVLARAPPVRPRRPSPAPPTYGADLQAYASDYTEEYAHTSPYANGPTPREEDEESQAVVIYARPNKNGGYSYSRRPAASTPRPKREPIVFRIHKYKIIKE